MNQNDSNDDFAGADTVKLGVLGFPRLIISRVFEDGTEQMACSHEDEHRLAPYRLIEGKQASRFPFCTIILNFRNEGQSEASRDETRKCMDSKFHIFGAPGL